MLLTKNFTVKIIVLGLFCLSLAACGKYNVAMGIINSKDSASSSDGTSPDISGCSLIGKSATIEWTTPFLREDGSPLSDLAGINIRVETTDAHGVKQVTKTINVDVNPDGSLNPPTTFVIDNLVSGRNDFSLTAYDSEGLESVGSPSICGFVP